VNGDDRGVIEATLDLRLAHEALDLARSGITDDHPLDRDLTTDLAIVREHDLAHPAAGDHLADVVSITRRLERPGA
jgi:hypothetical protein